MPRLRILPITIFVASLMMTVKVGNVWHGLSTILNSVEVPEADAQQTPARVVGPALQQIPGPGKLEEPLPEGVKPLATIDTAPVVDDPSSFTPSEIRLLQELADRRKLLEDRERKIQQREVLLMAAEQRLVDKQKTLDAARAELQSLLKKYDTEEKQQLEQLVKIYENMKPKDAATIFNELEMPVLLGVVENMNVRKVAPVIAAMQPEKAREVTRELAERQQLPKLPR